MLYLSRVCDLKAPHDPEKCTAVSGQIKGQKAGLYEQQKKFKTLWTSVLSSFSCRPWWKWRLWNLEVPVSVASVIFSLSSVCLRPWSLAIGLFSCCGAQPFICTWVSFFSGVQPHHLTSELKQLWKGRESTKGDEEETRREVNLGLNSSFQIKFHKPILVFLAFCLWCFYINCVGSPFLFPPS